MLLRLLSRFSAREHWKNGQFLLHNEEEFREAQMYAPYWAKYVAELPDMDEEMHLCVLHFYGYVADRAFWEALLRRYPQESPYVWYTALDTIVGCGNVPALNTLETKFDKQTLFYCFHGDGTNNRPMHPAALQWFLQDEGLHEPLRQYVYVFQSGWYRENRWDAVNQTLGSRAMVSIVEQWCELPDAWFPQEHALKLVLSWVGLQAQMATDPAWIKQVHHLQTVLTKTELDKAIHRVGERARLHLGLLRAVGGKMEGEDYREPALCAIAQYRALKGADPFHNMHGRNTQVANNAKRALPIQSVLELHGETRELPMYYLLELLLRGETPADNELDFNGLGDVSPTY
jgi:hypothetical protein